MTWQNAKRIDNKMAKRKRTNNDLKYTTQKQNIKQHETTTQI